MDWFNFTLCLAILISLTGCITHCTMSDQHDWRMDEIKAQQAILLPPPQFEKGE